MNVIETNSSKVYIGKDSILELNTILNDFENQKIFILVDENTMNHCLPVLIPKVPLLQDAEIIEIESGEENKTIDICYQIWRTLAEFEANRNSVLINLGGGVITDMGGFIASTYKRGISFVNIPTTLLSQIDASVGGKVGVDLGGLKNMVGVFNEPIAVLVEPDFLQTLNKRQLNSGLAEAYKHALIVDKEYWKSMKEVDLNGLKDIDSLINTSVNIKNEIVLRDPKEKNDRKLLNFGHTIGHAVETFSLSNPPELLHGEAIAIGMVVEAILSISKTSFQETELEEVVSFFNQRYNLSVINESSYKELLGLMKNDKKNESSEINFTLLEEIGKGVINCTANEDEIVTAFQVYNKMIS